MFNATKVAKTYAALLFDRVLRNHAANLRGVITSLSLCRRGEKVRSVSSAPWFPIDWRQTKERYKLA